jgi:glutamyl-tRNA reductase
VEVRERHTFPAHRMCEFLVALHDYEAVHEALMLATCNRLEIYAELEEYEAGTAQLKRFLTNFRHGDVADMDSYLYTMLGTQAVDHAFRVATGLDSMMIGEAEILGQVKDAFVQAQKARSLGKTLHRLFRDALNAGKAARSQTAIGRQSVSVATAAIEAAKVNLGELAGRSVLVVGAGKMGALAAKRLKLEGARDIAVLNRSYEKAAGVIEHLGTGHALEMGELVGGLKHADIVVTSTGASHFVLGVSNVSEAMRARPDRPLFIVDIAVPRDTDPEVARIPNVSVVDIDALKGVVEVSLEHRREAVPLVEEIIGEHVERFNQWYRARTAVPVIASLTDKAETIREAELERLFARCPELSGRERMLITGMSLTIISKLLHTAITRIRDKAIEDGGEAQLHARILAELFELGAISADLTVPASGNGM